MKKIFALADERISDKCTASLKLHGFTPIKLPKISGLAAPIASHTDIISFKLNDKLFLSKAYFNKFFSLFAPLNRENIIITNDIQGVNYPLDAVFNGLLIGGKLFCKRESFSREILSYAEPLGIKIINVKQGYPACTALKISENAVITADRGMAKALQKEKISVLLTENGGISLPPYEYGFIGGAGALYGESVFFLGDISTHPCGEKIRLFAEQHGKRVFSLSDEPLCDLGGILFIEEDI